MTPDQLKRLNDLSEKLAEVAIVDADPENWVGFGELPKDLTAADRGNAVWCRKVALATISVLSRVVAITAQVQTVAIPRQPGQEETDGDNLLNDEIDAAEREGKRLLDELLKRKEGQSKPKQKATHGKP